MFTGIVEETGRVSEARQSPGGRRLSIECRRVLEGTKVGDSIAVDGTCLTVVSLSPGAFSADVMPETLGKTTLKVLRPGALVNLERAVVVGGRLGGHMVTGHVDEAGHIMEKRPSGNAVLVRVGISPSALRYIVPRGSVAVDGISLTVVERLDSGFTVSIIPHTAAGTTLGSKRSGDPVNVETDIIGRYVESLMDRGEGKGLSRELLAKAGFLT
ncbi:MAG: riboflavin synthase [Bacillota bacterium]